ncbi:uncharacterized protein PV09_03960 [Verruconis gallopava]|uniref:Uncharacterized protein n=1 Tax=Verruconis gallopava TaxID=253628 RepID=A0A0D2B068_9PEZI|nr:uncharacterized protein PV09_03960 [Verruconis gallopava]KIW04769.1 hypothetical protein PV09_03960 [Verruconis gallopava]
MTTASRGEASGSDLATVGLLELLKDDQRPTCVVDLDHISERENLPRICFRNARFAKGYDFELPSRNTDAVDDERVHFRNWALSRYAQERPTINCHGMSWIANTVRKRWRVIQATSTTAVSDDSDSDALHHDLRHAGVAENLPKGSAEAHHKWLHNLMQNAQPHDWTAPICPRKLTSHSQFLRDWDWSKTPLGPLETWSSRLRLMANLITVDPNPAVLFWGKELAGIYNEAYVPMLHDKHPKSLGEPYYNTWSELYRQEEVAKTLNDLWTRNVRGEPIFWQHRTFYLRNGNRLQEHIVNLSFLPVIDEDGKTVGFYEQIKEITQDALNERRSENIRKINELTAGEEDPTIFYKKIMTALEPNGNDFPFAMLYSLEPSKIDWKRPFLLNEAIENGLAKLESYMGVRILDNDEPAVHQKLICEKSFLEVFEQVCRSGKLETFDLESRSHIALAIMEEQPNRSFGDQPRLSVLIPIESITHNGVNAVLLVGMNTRRPYDADYEAFLRNLSRTISSSLAALILGNEQKKRVGEALQMEKRAVSMLEASPVGACLLAMDGTIIYANSSWTNITAYSYNNLPFAWLEIMTEESAARAKIEWSLVAEQRQERTFELTLRKPWVYADPTSGDIVKDQTKVLVSALVQTIGEEEYVISVVTDISYQKWIESMQDKRRQEALEMKRAQENFMDITSHEMRNPLSAIFQCADAIVNALSILRQNVEGTSHPSQADSQGLESGARKRDGFPMTFSEAIAHAIENAGTITLCAQHQRRIVDDVLVLSKVDAKLIEIHPVEVQPLALAEDAIRMFAAELAANKARMALDVEASFKELHINWVKLDPGRLLQVLINLCTNAIKFSMDSLHRDISIRVGASTTVPQHSSQGVSYLHGVDGEVFDDPTVKPEWGCGETLYLQFQVTDTGQGMTAEEMTRLFQRFKQASPRTHTQYGGSGLGLFIARLLSRLQGGEIGVSSVRGKGTTFAFYVKVRRTEDPRASDLQDCPVRSNILVGDQGEKLSAGVSPRLKAPSEIDVIVVEDNLVNQRVLSKQLKTQGFSVSIANNGAECIEMIKRCEHWATNGESRADKRMRSPCSKVSIILMDIEMPVMNGIEATSLIRTYERSGELRFHIPIIAITANARLEQVAIAKNAGMDDVLSKPFRIPELMAKIDIFVGPLQRGLV